MPQGIVFSVDSNAPTPGTVVALTGSICNIPLPPSCNVLVVPTVTAAASSSSFAIVAGVIDAHPSTVCRTAFDFDPPPSVASSSNLLRLCPPRSVALVNVAEPVVAGDMIGVGGFKTPTSIGAPTPTSIGASTAAVVLAAGSNSVMAWIL
jgi:hypothetical protein